MTDDLLGGLILLGTFWTIMIWIRLGGIRDAIDEQTDVLKKLK